MSLFAPDKRSVWAVNHGQEPPMIEMIIYHNGMPFDVTTTDNSRYDFEWCPMEETLAYHYSGGGCGNYLHRLIQSPGEGLIKIWLRGTAKVEFQRYSKRERRRRRHPNRWNFKSERPTNRQLRAFGYERIESPIHYRNIEAIKEGIYEYRHTANPFEWDLAQEAQTEWCGVCQARRLEDDYENPCEHLQWCEDCGCYGGLGADQSDMCKCEEAAA